MLLLIIIVSIISYILFSRWSVFYLLESLAVQKDHTPTLLLEIRSSVNRLVDVGDEMTRTMLLFTFFFTSLTTEGKLFLRLWITKWCFLCFEKHLCKASTCFVSATDDDTYYYMGSHKSSSYSGDISENTWQEYGRWQQTHSSRLWQVWSLPFTISCYYHFILHYKKGPAGFLLKILCWKSAI